MEGFIAIKVRKKGNNGVRYITPVRRMLASTPRNDVAEACRYYIKEYGSDQGFMNVFIEYQDKSGNKANLQEWLDMQQT